MAETTKPNSGTTLPEMTGRTIGSARARIELCSNAPSKGHQTYANTQRPVHFLHLRCRQLAESLD